MELWSKDYSVDCHGLTRQSTFDEMIFNFLQVSAKKHRYYAIVGPTTHSEHHQISSWCDFWSPGTWIDLVPQIPIPANFFPWVVMKEKLLLENLALLMELSTVVIHMYQGYTGSIKMCKSKYNYLLHFFWIIILYSFCHNVSHSQACVVKMLPSFQRTYMLFT